MVEIVDCAADTVRHRQPAVTQALRLVTKRKPYDTEAATQLIIPATIDTLDKTIREEASALCLSCPEFTAAEATALRENG